MMDVDCQQLLLGDIFFDQADPGEHPETVQHWGTTLAVCSHHLSCCSETSGEFKANQELLSTDADSSPLEFQALFLPKMGILQQLQIIKRIFSLSFYIRCPSSCCAQWLPFSSGLLNQPRTSSLDVSESGFSVRNMTM